MEYLKEDLWRLVITVVVTVLVIAGGAWYEYRTGTLESLINLPDFNVVTEVSPEPVLEPAE